MDTRFDTLNAFSIKLDLDPFDKPLGNLKINQVSLKMFNFFTSFLDLN